MVAERRTLVVAGGSGFVGRHVCRFAISIGHDVIGLSRRGRPETGEPWEEGVEWHRGDVLAPETWRTKFDLGSCDAAIAALGTTRPSPDDGETFERFNRDAVVQFADVARDAAMPTFVLLSAASRPPGIAEGYLEAEREAESRILEMGFERRAVLRSPPAYGAERPTSVAAIPLLRSLGGDDSGSELEPIPVEQIAIALLRAALEPDVEGVLSAEEVADLGEAVMIQ